MRRASDSSPQPIRLPAPASSSSSPTDECRVFANLSPLEKAEPYIQRFKGSNNYTSRRQLFTSPQQETVFKEVNLTANDGIQIPRSDKDIVKSCSPSECAQECLADPDELNSINSADSKSGSAVPSETLRKPDDGDSGTRDLACQEVQPHKMDETTGDQMTVERSEELNNVGSTMCLRTLSREQSVPQGNEGSYSIILNGVEYDVGNLGGSGPSSNISLNGGSHSDEFQDAGGGYDKHGPICQTPSECNKIVDASQDHNISSRPESNKDAMDTNQNKCGTDANFQSETANDDDSRSIVRCSSYTSENPTYNFAGLSLPASQLFSDAKQKGICNYALPISSVGSDTNNGERSMKPVSRYGHDLVRNLDCSSALLSLANTQHGDLQGNQNAVAATSNDSRHLMQVEQHQASCEENNLVVESTSRFEDLNQMSPKRKRKRATIPSETDGCKLCNCKRSKCLKLYCECFAAGIYCLDTCACVNCFNKPEYEDTVLDARQQIESRNPHAFAPKVIKHAMDSPRNVTVSEDRNGTTSSSARHKRGCNCKKSKCRKKYCECYQSKVGCSDGCRCDNCQNSFGTRKETVYERVERWKNESHEKMNTGQTNTDSIKAMGGAQFSSAWQELGNTSNFCPSAVHSTPSNLWNYTEVSQTQLGNRFQADGSFHWQYPPQS